LKTQSEGKGRRAPYNNDPRLPISRCVSMDEIIHEGQVLAFVILPLVNVRGCTLGCSWHRWRCSIDSSRLPHRVMELWITISFSEVCACNRSLM
jgi:hypothetical protein